MLHTVVESLRVPAYNGWMAVGDLRRKANGDLAELKVATDLLDRGYRIALPYGEDWNYDLILCRGEKFERVQVKHARSDGRVVVVRCSSQSLTSGRVRRVKRYTARTIDWLAAYDVTTDRCFYIPAGELGEGHRMLSLRLQPSRNNQRACIRSAEDYTAI